MAIAALSVRAQASAFAHCLRHIVFGTLSLALCHSNCEDNVPKTMCRRQCVEDSGQ
jgi:hypothetical protein